MERHRVSPFQFQFSFCIIFPAIHILL
jgi:hypothetical protein